MVSSVYDVVDDKIDWLGEPTMVGWADVVSELNFSLYVNRSNQSNLSLKPDACFAENEAGGLYKEPSQQSAVYYLSIHYRIFTKNSRNN